MSKPKKTKEELAWEREWEREWAEKDRKEREAREQEQAKRRQEYVANWHSYRLTPEILQGLAQVDRICTLAHPDPAVTAALRWIARQRDSQAKIDEGWIKSLETGWI